MMPSFFPNEITPCTTFSCIKLKHMAITAIPIRMYMKQKMNWTLTRLDTPSPVAEEAASESESGSEAVGSSALREAPGTMSPKPIVLRMQSI